MECSTAATKPTDCARPRSTRFKLLFALVVFLLYSEFLARLFWWYDRSAPPWSASCLYYAFHPQLNTTGVEATSITNTDTIYDILILGGSTISEAYGPIGKCLGDSLQQRLQRPTRVFNVAWAGHNSRDSLIKFRRLAQQHFDLVVVYDGINDTRMNNAPPGQFAADYSHCFWYKHINFLDRHPRLARVALPFTLMYTSDRITEASGLVWCLPRLNPKEGWTEYGKDVRTPGPFQNHLDEIASTVQQQGGQLVLMTFSYHLPAGYSTQDLNQMSHEYALGTSRVHLWGEPAQVVAALDQQNDAIRELAGRRQEVVFIDQQRLMPRSSRTFRDCCHFTLEGCELFVQNILTGLAERDSK